jgi:hypothetical protein
MTRINADDSLCPGFFRVDSCDSRAPLTVIASSFQFRHFRKLVSIRVHS